MIDFPGVDTELASDLDAAEKNELEAYLDSLGFWTIGRGHLLPKPAPGKSWAGFTILPAVSDRYFLGDILGAINHAKKLPEWESLETNCRQNALIELCFNMGGKWEAWGPTRGLIRAKDWQAVHDHLLNSLWASQIQPHHYTADGTCTRCQHIRAPEPPYSHCAAIPNGRAVRLANYFLTGAYPNG